MNDPLSPNQTACPFCAMAPSVTVISNYLAFAIRDLNPVTPLHSLILPYRHVPTYFDLSHEEAVAADELLRQLRDEIAAQDRSVEGFNIGVNVGTVAGQTIPHCHIHLIPRRRGDVPDPWGGVRAIFPGKARYPRGTSP
jgi:diadenosine tetraphosphate (Ap4A) HIT family hydrolase